MIQLLHNQCRFHDGGGSNSSESLRLSWEDSPITNVTNRSRSLLTDSQRIHKSSFVKHLRCSLHKTFTVKLIRRWWRGSTWVTCNHFYLLHQTEAECTDGRVFSAPVPLYTHSISGVHTAHGSGTTMLVDINGWSWWFNTTMYLLLQVQTSDLHS